MCAAHRRRKSSADERGFDSPTTPKRPRVFFTEDQKEALRAAYHQDPYPNQSTIESLASELGVGVKTVINWFHNHRMRAKQQHHAGASSDGSSDQGNNGGVKSEPPDDNSNHSDMSSVSGDVACQQAVAAAAAAAIRQVETSQWMFPRFEPVGLLQRKSSEEWDHESLDDRMDETDGPPVSGKEESDKSDSPTEAVSVPLPPPPPAPPVGVNKRKRSNPQRVYEGTQLDRTKLHKVSTSAISVVSEEGVDVVGVSEEAEEPSTSMGATVPQSGVLPDTPTDHTRSEAVCAAQDGLKTEREQRISKLQHGLRESAGWGDEEDGEEGDSQTSVCSNGEKGPLEMASSSLLEESSTSAAAPSNSQDWEF